MHYCLIFYIIQRKFLQLEVHNKHNASLLPWF